MTRRTPMQTIRTKPIPREESHDENEGIPLWIGFNLFPNPNLSTNNILSENRELLDLEMQNFRNQMLRLNQEITNQKKLEAITKQQSTLVNLGIAAIGAGVLATSFISTSAAAGALISFGLTSNFKTPNNAHKVKGYALKHLFRLAASSVLGGAIAFGAAHYVTDALQQDSNDGRQVEKKDAPQNRVPAPDRR